MTPKQITQLWNEMLGHAAGRVAKTAGGFGQIRQFRAGMFAAARTVGGSRLGLAVMAAVVAGGVATALVVIPGSPPRPAAPPRSAPVGPARASAPRAAKIARVTRPGTIPALPGWTLVATLNTAVPRYASPGGQPDGRVSATWYGRPSVLPVIGQKPGWVRVRLATRPNGSTAWLRTARLTFSQTPYRIVVNLHTMHLQMLKSGRILMDAPAGIGAGSDPTPTGQFFLAFFEQSLGPGYGPFILVTSAHSDAIADWEGSGDAVIGIHGPLGADIGPGGVAVSHGCVRLPVSDLVKLAGLPAGTPITITA
jgi:hypothetical protein